MGSSLSVGSYHTFLPHALPLEPIPSPCEALSSFPDVVHSLKSLEWIKALMCSETDQGGLANSH